MGTQKISVTVPWMILGVTLLLLGSCEKNSTTNEILVEDVNIALNGKMARSEAKQLYEDYYLASTSTTEDIAWTGDELSCSMGTVPPSTIDKILLRLAYFRKAAGLSNVVLENATKSSKAQAAALMMYANSKLGHFPSNTWKCYSAEGSEGAGNSLLAIDNNAEAIDSYIRDNGDANGPVGHRRWLLLPKLREIGIGNTPNTNALWVMGNSGMPTSDVPEFIAWPPPGYIPKQFVYPRWSFSISGAEFTNTQVSMKDRTGKVVQLSIERLDNAYGDRTIVWVPQGLVTNETVDTPYTVTLQDVSINGQLKTFEYVVVLFDVNG